MLIRSVGRLLVVPGLAVSLSSAAMAQAGATHEREAHDLGAVHFRVSCSTAVQADFDRAVALLHHMMYEESRRAFEAIAARDAECGMAHWGIAVTLFQPLWPKRPPPEALRRGWAEVQRAEALHPATDRERDLLAAAHAFFREPDTADWWTRIRRWEHAMDAAYRRRPDDIETAAFYALSHLAAGYVAEDRMAHQTRAAEVLRAIYQREPTHPGAIHYMIHANDVDGRANEAPEIVRRYGDIAPSVPHALHMPTHIFLRLGDWPEVISWNIESAAAALRFPVGDSVSNHYPHAMAYLLYAHLQRGEDGKARAAVDDVLGRAPYQEDFITAFHLAEMPARYAVERRAWPEAAALEPRTPATVAWDRYPWPEALRWFARGLGAAHTGQLGDARAAEQRMRGLRDQAETAGERDFARYIETDRLILAGRLALGAGDTARAIEELHAAVTMERSVQKHPVTPGALIPAHEALADLLLDVGRPAEALGPGCVVSGRVMGSWTPCGWQASVEWGRRTRPEESPCDGSGAPRSGRARGTRACGRPAAPADCRHAR